MTAIVHVSGDAGAVAVGADRVAADLAALASARERALTIRRPGSRGAFWLEPLVEVETPTGRVAYGPVAPTDLPGLVDAGLLDGAPGHPLSLGPTEEIPWLAGQTRVTFARCGVIEPLDLEAYRANGGLAGLERALALEPSAVVDAVEQSGLRGRGGAAFPTGVKWRTAAETPAERRYVAINADEGDSGTFADRMLLEGDPFAILEGMAIAAHAIGADTGFVYIRSEYPHGIRVVQAAIDAARAAGWLGPDALGPGRPFDVEIRVGAGAYICGEETSMLESIEGKRGQIRPKPPVPAIAGLWGMPTIVQNVVTIATVPPILARGPEAYAELGVGRSRGTITAQLAGNVARPGLVEVPFGVSLGELVTGYGGGTRSGRPLRAVQVGGPLGAYVDEEMLELAVDYEALAEGRALLGHGGIVVFDDTVDMAEQARFAMEFCSIESCGKCTPCRIGSVRGRELIEQIVRGEEVEASHGLLLRLCDLMEHASLCALGGLTSLPVLSALRLFPEDFGLTRETAHVV
ncbi:MAG: formate dehydrogenase beta subunit [Gaiella sp.]